MLRRINLIWNIHPEIHFPQNPVCVASKHCFFRFKTLDGSNATQCGIVWVGPDFIHRNKIIQFYIKCILMHSFISIFSPPCADWNVNNAGLKLILQLVSLYDIHLKPEHVHLVPEGLWSVCLRPLQTYTKGSCKCTKQTYHIRCSIASLQLHRKKHFLIRCDLL